MGKVGESCDIVPTPKVALVGLILQLQDCEIQALPLQLQVLLGHIDTRLEHIPGNNNHYSRSFAQEDQPLAFKTSILLPSHLICTTFKGVQILICSWYIK